MSIAVLSKGYLFTICLPTCVSVKVSNIQRSALGSPSALSIIFSFNILTSANGILISLQTSEIADLALYLLIVPK